MTFPFQSSLLINLLNRRTNEVLHCEIFPSQNFHYFIFMIIIPRLKSPFMARTKQLTPSTFRKREREIKNRTTSLWMTRDQLVEFSSRCWISRPGFPVKTLIPHEAGLAPIFPAGYGTRGRCM